MKLTFLQSLLCLVVDVLDEPEGFLVFVDEGQGVWLGAGGQQFLVLALGNVRRVAAALDRPILTVEKQPDRVQQVWPLYFAKQKFGSFVEGLLMAAKNHGHKRYIPKEILEIPC